MKLSDSVLIESKSARDQGVSEIVSQGLQQSLLGKVKSIFFALWGDSSYMTTKQVADYYGVPENTIRQNYIRFKAEFDADGVVKLHGELLRELRDILSLSSFTPQATLFTPRSVIRMGFILQESEVAVQVRTAALNLIQGVGQFFDHQIIEALIEGYPVLEPFTEKGNLVVSSPLFSYYDAVERHIKRRYPNGGIPGLKKDDIRQKLASLSTYTSSWKFDTQKELRYSLNSSVCAKYPDLTSKVVLINVDGQVKTAVMMFHLSDLLVDERDVESAIGRQYIKRAKEHFQVDYAFLFLVAPFGATPRAENYIRRDLTEEMKGFVGVMTVKEVANLLLDQAKTERAKNLMNGKIKQEFGEILNYKIPSDPLLLML
jgi:hypothetical protein